MTMANIYWQPPPAPGPLPEPPRPGLPGPIIPPKTPAPTQPPWRWGGDIIAGRPRSYWEQNPAEFMNLIMNQRFAGASVGLRGWLQDQSQQQASLWNAYKQRFGQMPDVYERPLGDWLESFVSGVAPPWGRPQGENIIPAYDQQRRFFRDLMGALMGPEQWARDWRASVNTQQNPYAALELANLASGYAPMVSSALLGQARDLRTEYGGLGEGGPATYAEWLWRRMGQPSPVR